MLRDAALSMMLIWENLHKLFTIGKDALAVPEEHQQNLVGM